MLRIFVGWDKKETLAFHTTCQSIFEKSRLNLSVTPIGNDTLPESVWWRKRGEYDTTDFSNARFMAPFLCGFEGWSLFIDPDMLLMADIADLFSLRDEKYAVQVVKHDYQPKAGNKAMGVQTLYKRKNWSSVILFNNARCRVLTPEYVNGANGLDLHQFAWLNGHEIGGLPREWNHLVGEYPYREDPKLIHWTIGGPYMEGYEYTDYCEEWSQVYDRLKRVDGRSSRV